MPTPANAARYAWYVIALLFPVALLNYFDRQMLATMKASMVGDIPSIANKADWGFVLGCFFILVILRVWIVINFRGIKCIVINTRDK